MPDRPVDDLPPHDRRRFFAAGLGRLLGPLSSLLEKKLPISLPQLRPLLRPPGAIAEAQFLQTCFRSGACADACPAHAIELRPPSAGDDERGTPYVNPNLSACVVCDELACMKACPSGALRLVGRREIRMGLAQLNDDLCVRTHGESCTLCVDKCPLGDSAIQIVDGRVSVYEPVDREGLLGDGCVGCGVCQYYCPTTPKAIVIEPA